MNDCIQFPFGSRTRQICEGESELPRAKENKFRAKYGLDPLPEDELPDEPSKPMRGLGDAVARVIKKVTLGKVKPCGGCAKRQDVLNKLVPFSRVKKVVAAKQPQPTRVVGVGPPIEAVALDNATRHLTFHVWPVKGFGAWQWNCDRLLANAELFNGRRIVSIATDSQSDSAEMVKDYLTDFTDEFIVVRNDPKLREVVTWLPMLKLLEPYQSESDVTFSCHGKCVRHKIVADNEGSTVFRWADAMWELCLDWDTIRPLLETHATAGAFRRFGELRGITPWHYSGTFFWWRNRDAFRRDWQYVPQFFAGTEAWPGLMFTDHEAAVIACDKVENLYNLPYWKSTIEPQLNEWRASHERLSALKS